MRGLKPYDEVRNQVGYCGIWCGGCPGGNGSVQELTKRYEKFIVESQVEPYASKDFNFEEFKKGLASIQCMSSCTGCLKGGGNPNCEIRMCAKTKGYINCCDCPSFDGCSKFEELEKLMKDIKSNLKKMKEVCRHSYIRDQERELALKWPYSILTE